MEVFGSWDAIVEASAEPVEALRRRRRRDPERPTTRSSRAFAERTRARVATFGRAPTRTSGPTTSRLIRDGRASFELRRADERAHVSLAVPGEHMVPQRARRRGRRAGAGRAARGVRGRAAEPHASHRWRMETTAHAGGVRVVNDAYNANPESVAAALKTAPVDGGGRPIDRGARTDGGARRRSPPRSTSGWASSPPGCPSTGSSRSDRRPRRSRSPRVREGVEPDNVVAYDDPDAALADVLAAARAGDVVAGQGVPRRRSRAVGDRLAEALVVISILVAAGIASRSCSSGRRSRSTRSAVGVGPADPRGRAAYAHGEDGHADDGRHRDLDRVRARLPRVADHDAAIHGHRARLGRRGGRVRGRRASSTTTRR